MDGFGGVEYYSVFFTPFPRYVGGKNDTPIVVEAMFKICGNLVSSKWERVAS